MNLTNVQLERIKANINKTDSRTPIRPGCQVWVRPARCYATVLDMDYSNDWVYVVTEKQGPADITRAYTFAEVAAPVGVLEKGQYVMVRDDLKSTDHRPWVGHGIGVITHVVKNDDKLVGGGIRKVGVVWGRHDEGHKGVELDPQVILLVDRDVGAELAPELALNFKGKRRFGFHTPEHGLKWPPENNLNTLDHILDKVEKKSTRDDLFKPKKTDVALPAPKPKSLNDMVQELQKRQDDIVNDRKAINSKIEELTKMSLDLEEERKKANVKALKLLALAKAIDDLKGEYDFQIEAPKKA